MLGLDAIKVRLITAKPSVACLIYSRVYRLLLMCIVVSTSILSRARGYKTFFMLNSVKHEILNTHKYHEIQLFSDSDKPRMLFCLLINVKMPTIVGILTFMSRKIFMLN